MIVITYYRLMDRQAFWSGLRRLAIIDQQLWYLGKDIAAPTGNALRAYGFTRRRSATGTGSSAYLIPLQPDPADDAARTTGMLVCWGFGVYAGDVLVPGDASTSIAPLSAMSERTTGASIWAGAVIERFRDTPGLVRHPLSPDIHQVSSLPRSNAPRTEDDRNTAVAALRAIARTMAAYERWAIATLGVMHREHALRDAPRHKRHRFSRVTDLSGIWDAIARETPRDTHADQAPESTAA
jgi:hypothetical protein